MQLQKLIAEKQQGPGWVRVVLTNCVLTPGYYRCQVEWLGHRDPYLSASGWKGSVNLINVELTSGPEQHEISFLFEPEVVQYMEASANYQLSIVNSAGTPIDACAMRWKGVPSYRPPKPATSGLEAAVEPLFVKSSVPVELESGPVLEQTFETFSPLGHTDEIVFPMPVETPPLPTQESPPELILEPQVKAAEIFKIDCPYGTESPLGPHKIFSNTVFCPICSRPV